MSAILDERFLRSELSPRLQWYCEPARWEVSANGEGLRLWPDAKTDFWQRTHYGFRADNGHLLHALIEGDFVLETAVTSRGLYQYDQAGLMLRYSADSWLKCSVEFETEGPNRLGAVLTRDGYSDWSTQDVVREIEQWRFRIARTGSCCLVEASHNGKAWNQIRLAYLEADGPVQAGIYACSPKENGFHARFHYLTITR